MRSEKKMRIDTGRRFSEQVKKEVALAVSMGKITLAEARKLHGIKGGNTLKGWINKYANGSYVPGKRGRKPAAEKSGLQLSGSSVSMIPAITTSNAELRQVLSKREIELKNELERIRRFRELIAKSEPKASSPRKNGSRMLSSITVSKGQKKLSTKNSASKRTNGASKAKSVAKPVGRRASR